MTQLKKLYIHTMGCQMNVVDSERITGILKPMGYTPAGSMEEADLIIANTCTIRQKAEQKAFSFLGRAAELKQKKPELIIGFGGCVAQQEGERLFKRFPGLDLVFGTDAIGRLPDMVRTIEKSRCRRMDVHMSGRALELPNSDIAPAVTEISKFVTIMRGCDNFCTYCVVPYVRGGERSRHPDAVMAEVCRLASAGIREVTLLGQNVNSYGRKEHLGSFADLLRKISTIEGIERIRFTTSHPKDLSEDLMSAFGALEKLCGHIHLPFQSGSDAVLKRMNRKYTRSMYLEKIDRLRAVCPDIAITSDVIVGFPGETEKDFLRTLDLIKAVEYDSLFIFNYSDRPNAPSAAFSGKVNATEKSRRFQAVLNLQERITRRINEQMVGSTVAVLVEGQSKRQRFLPAKGGQACEWSGRTATNKVVNFIDEEPVRGAGDNIVGELVNVHIEKALDHSLRGRRVTAGPSGPD